MLSGFLFISELNNIIAATTIYTKNYGFYFVNLIAQKKPQ